MFSTHPFNIILNASKWCSSFHSFPNASTTTTIFIAIIYRLDFTTKLLQALFLIAKKQLLLDQILLIFDLDLNYMGQGRQTKKTK